MRACCSPSRTPCRAQRIPVARLPARAGRGWNRPSPRCCQPHEPGAAGGPRLSRQRVAAAGSGTGGCSEYARVGASDPACWRISQAASAPIIDLPGQPRSSTTNRSQRTLSCTTVSTMPAATDIESGEQSAPDLAYAKCSLNQISMSSRAARPIGVGWPVNPWGASG